MYPLAGRRSALRCVTASGGHSLNFGYSYSLSAAARDSAGVVNRVRLRLRHLHSPSSSSSASFSTTASNSTSSSIPPPAPNSITTDASALRRTRPQHRRPVAISSSPTAPSQRRVLQTSSTSKAPSPTSSSRLCNNAPVETRSSLLPRLLSGRNRRLRYTHLPAIIMGASRQTRENGGDHKHEHGHGHSHGHSHGLGGHHHHHDTTYLVSRNRSDPGVRITNIGLASNLAMAVAKFLGGWAFNSKSMVADGWHSLTDLASDVLTLATVSYSIKPPTDRFPMGFGKIESLGALGVSGMLLVGGCYMGWESAISLYGHFNPEAAHTLMEHVGHGHSHSHSAASLGIPSIHAAWIAAGTILIKEWLYHATMKVARERHSSVLASNAVHHRVDSLTGIVTLVAIVGANLFHNAGWLDPVGGLLISIMVVHAGAGNMVDAFCELADQSIDEDVKHSVQKQAQKALVEMDASHEVELRDVSGIKSGQNYLMDLEMAVPGGWSVEHVRSMEEAVRQKVGAKVRGVKRVRVRFVTQGEAVNRKFDEFIQDRSSENERLEPEEESDEDSHEHHKHK